MQTPIRSLSRSPVALVFLAAVSVLCRAQAVTVTPTLVEAGSPELIRLSTGEASGVEGEWLGRKLRFFRGKDERTWYALGGVDVEAPAGASMIKISIRSEGATREVDTPITIHPAHYRTASITVAPKFVEPGPEDKKLIDAAAKAKEQVFAKMNAEIADTPQWSGSFAAPVTAQPTDSFGTRRMFNGKLASIHKGTDFRAGTGTPVLAGNAGTVVLAQALYYEGNCVMVDHGLGLMSISMHLSRIDVKPGQRVIRGEQLGLSGATGRVTGPHLHWAIRWEGAMLDPAKLLRMNLNAIR